MRPLLPLRLLRNLTIAALLTYLLSTRLPRPRPTPAPPPPLAQLYNYTLNSPHLPRGISCFPPDTLTKHLVLARTSTSDTSWLSLLPASLHITPILYHTDGPDQNIPVNKGNEAMTYLTYIIEHYSTLPDIVVFIHDHAAAWHNNELHLSTMALMLEELNWRRVVRKGYMNLRCHWRPGCPDWIKPKRDPTEFSSEKYEEALIAGSFMGLFGGTRDQVPETLGVPCCAQFAVTRDMVRRHTLEDYEKWRRWLMTTVIQSHYSGRVMEYLWHWIFTGIATVCPAEHVCYCDGYGICFGSEEEYDRYFELRQTTEIMAKRYDLAVERGPEYGEDLRVRERGMRELKERLAWENKELVKMVNVARLLGRHREVRRMEVGEEEFSG